MTGRNLVSCVLPTGDGRREFLPLALRCWSRQTHARRELIVVDDGSDDGAERLCRHLEGARVLRTDPAPLGTKLNAGIAVARGDVIQKWDDDDWYAPRFLAVGLAALTTLAPERRFVLWDEYLVLLAWTGRLYTTGPGHKAGCTLLFDRALWDTAPFRDLPSSVDSWFINDHGPFTPVRDPTAVVVVRHGANTWNEFWGTEVDRYIEAELDPWPEPLAAIVDAEDAAFYEALQQRLSAGPSPARG